MKKKNRPLPVNATILQPDAQTTLISENSTYLSQPHTYQVLLIYLLTAFQL